jgi:hypothetical protein
MQGVRRWRGSPSSHSVQRDGSAQPGRPVAAGLIGYDGVVSFVALACCAVECGGPGSVMLYLSWGTGHGAGPLCVGVGEMSGGLFYGRWKYVG